MQPWRDIAGESYTVKRSYRTLLYSTRTLPATIRRALCHRAGHAYLHQCICCPLQLSCVHICGPSNSPLSRLMLRRYAAYVSPSNHHCKSPYLCASLLMTEHGFPRFFSRIDESCCSTWNLSNWLESVDRSLVLKK